MNRTLVVLSAVCAFALSGCVLVKSDRKGTGSSRSGLSSPGKKDCHPSQYWDGEKCKHKGKGKGARKHDD
jgi:hypothetical protein